MPEPWPHDPPPGIAPGQPAVAATKAILADCAAEFERHRAGLMRSDAPEGAHQARVALRRLRTALAAFGPILRRRPAATLRREARSIFRTLGKLRDADVLAGEIAEGEETARLAARATRIRRKVRRKLEAAEAAGFSGRVAALNDDRRRRRRRARRLAEGPVEALAAKALDAAWTRLGSHGSRVSRMTGGDRHAFRKDLKALRYLTGFFGPLWDGRRQQRFMDRLKRLQDALGTLNDLSLAEGRLGSSGRAARAERAATALAEAGREWKALRRTSRWWRRRLRSNSIRQQP